MIEFQDQVAIVTGAGRGLGRAYAEALAERGATVVVNDLGGSRDGRQGSTEAADSIVADIRAKGGEAMADYGSVSDETAMRSLVAKVLDRYGRIDMIVNNAGILRDKSFAKMDMEDFRQVLDVHLMGAVILTHAAWPVMQQAGYGRIVFTSSASGLYGNFGQANYGAAKLALIGLMNTLRIEGQKYDIRVNAIAPAATTRMTAELLPPDAAEALSPEKVAPGVVYLCSKEAPSGKILAAGGGVFAMASIAETEGLFLGDKPTPEQVAAAIDDIGTGPARTLTSAFDQTAKFFQIASTKS